MKVEQRTTEEAVIVELTTEEGSRQKLCVLQNFVNCGPPRPLRTQEAESFITVLGPVIFGQVEVEVSVAQKMFAHTVFLALLPLPLMQHKVEHKDGNWRILGVFVVFFCKSGFAAVGVVI